MVVEKKKRGRKPKKVDFDEEMLVDENSFEIKEQLILHLPIKHDDIITVNFQEQIKIKEPREESSKIIKQENPQHEVFTKNNPELAIQTETIVSTFYGLPVDSVKSDGTFVPQKTNICCWWCAHQFDNYPTYLPVKYVEKDDSFKVKGIFCSFECSAAYGLKFEKDMTSLYLIKFFYKKLHKSKGQTHINIAPPKEILQKFGGNVRIEEYRENNHLMFVDRSKEVTEDTIISNTYFMNSFPVKFIPIQIGNKKIKTLLSSSMKKNQRKNKPLDLK